MVLHGVSGCESTSYTIWLQEEVSAVGYKVSMYVFLPRRGILCASKGYAPQVVELH